MPKRKVSAEIQRHWDRVGQLPCLVTGYPEPTLHHCHGGSMTRLIGLKGGALKTSDWLVIPLTAKLHTGDLGIDGFIGVKTWEALYGTQVQFLNTVCKLLGYNVWEKAGISQLVLNAGGEGNEKK